MADGQPAAPQPPHEVLPVQPVIPPALPTKLIVPPAQTGLVP